MGYICELSCPAGCRPIPRAAADETMDALVTSYSNRLPIFSSMVVSPSL